MSAREELSKIVYQSKLNSSLLFLVKDRKGDLQYIPLDGIGYCVENLKETHQKRFLDHCRKLIGDQDALLKFLKRLARTVASRKL
jgi:hypothetical protein